MMDRPSLDDRVLNLGRKAASLYRNTKHAELVYKLAQAWLALDDDNKKQAEAKVPYTAALSHIVNGGVSPPAAIKMCGLDIV